MQTCSTGRPCREALTARSCWRESISPIRPPPIKPLSSRAASGAVPRGPAGEPIERSEFIGGPCWPPAPDQLTGAAGSLAVRGLASGLEFVPVSTTEQATEAWRAFRRGQAHGGEPLLRLATAGCKLMLLAPDGGGLQAVWWRCASTIFLRDRLIPCWLIWFPRLGGATSSALTNRNPAAGEVAYASAHLLLPLRQRCLDQSAG